MIRHFDRLVDAVQTNCHITDARYAGEMTLCTYLLQMREFYCWEHDIAFSKEPPRAEVGEWLSEREVLWASFEGKEFMALPVEDRQFEPFATSAINDVLTPHGLIYGAGIGRFGKPQFFLGQLKRQERRDDASIFVAGCEYARDLTAGLAALSDTTIYLRQESLKHWLWEKFQVWRVKKPDGALKATLEAYGFQHDPYSALERMADAESETLILHELGELSAGKLLGGEWEDMYAGFTSRRAEIFVRALRDNLADCLVTLPALLERDAFASIHFWFSNFQGMRRELFPRMVSAYAAWREAGAASALHAAILSGSEHWRSTCEHALELHRSRGVDAEAGIENLIDAHGSRL
ncbi:MAG: Sfum_1244 family protein [Burkholderiales bacterium]